jgi:hypothetical protein
VNPHEVGTVGASQVEADVGPHRILGVAVDEGDRIDEAALALRVGKVASTGPEFRQPAMTVRRLGQARGRRRRLGYNRGSHGEGMRSGQQKEDLAAKMTASCRKKLANASVLRPAKPAEIERSFD